MEQNFKAIHINPHKGIELRAVMEQPNPNPTPTLNPHWTSPRVGQVTGDVYYLDRLERIAFNALPGTIDPTQWRHQYLQQAGSAAASPALRSKSVPEFLFT